MVSTVIFCGKRTENIVKYTKTSNVRTQGELMNVNIAENNTGFCSCYTHPFTSDDKGRIYCRAAMRDLGEDILICRDCPLMMYDAENERYFGCYYYDTQPSSALSDKERIKMAVDEMRLPQFPYFEEEDRHLVEHALQYAAEVHAGICRKGNNLPYVLHIIETSGIVHKMTDDTVVIAAAALHDVIEDTDVTQEDIRLEFGEDVCRLVMHQTEEKRRHIPAHKTWEIRKKEALERYAKAPLDAKRIALADKVSNMRASKRDFDRVGISMWNKFNQNDPERQEWYYRGILESLKELSDTDAYREYESLVNSVF